MHGPLQKLYQERRIEKEYVLEVSGNPAWSSLDYQAPIAEDPLHDILRKVHPDGKKAHSIFHVLSNIQNSSGKSRSLLSALLKTGRTHQLRVHAASLDFPIVGDNFYMGEEDSELHLLSSRLQFAHPLSGELLERSLPEELLPAWVKAFPLDIQS